MTSHENVDIQSAPSAAATGISCCGRLMRGIVVSAPLTDPSSALHLLACSVCASHVWMRSGEVLDRAAVLGVVKARVEEGPAPRVPRPRAPRKPRDRSRV